MIVKWRGDEYEFKPRTIQGGADTETKFSNVDSPIFGSDTESVQLADRYEPQCFTFSSESQGDAIVYLGENVFALKRYIEWIIATHGDELLEAGSAFIYFHNLEYDWLQLVKNDPRLLEMARIGVGLNEDLELFRIGAYKVTLKKDGLFAGSSPHFTIRIAPRKGGFNLFFRDTFSFFPGSLAKVSKDLGLNAKMDRQEDLGLRDFREEPDSEDKRYFEEYAKIDASNTRGIGEAIRDLHHAAEMTKIRASAPGYAIARVFHLMGEDRSIMTGSWDEKIMQLIFDSYRGGRTGGIFHGEVDNLSILDFHSSYPASMCALPSFSPEMAYIKIDDLRLENVLPILEETGNVFLRVSGEETDDLYPALITTHNGKLTPIYGRFENIATTGVELLVGIKSGSIKDLEILECVVLLDMEEDPYLPFKEFAVAAYERKAKSVKGSSSYVSSKLELNSAYGKLIESRTQTLIGASDYKTHFPFIEGMEKDFGNYYYKKYIEALEDGRTLEDDYESILDEIIENFPEEIRRDMRDKMFGDFSISGRIYGRYVIPAAASLITATSRARLCAAMKVLGALYWDTDSVFIVRDDLSASSLNNDLALTDSWFAKNVQKLRVGDELGDLDCEIVGARGYLAGIKRYHLQINCPDCIDYILPLKDCKKCKGYGLISKSATHGIPALKYDEIGEVIRSLATGKDYSYKSKPKPMKAKEAKSVADIGSFQVKTYRSGFHLDERLLWDRLESGYIGSVKPFLEIANFDLTDEQYQNYLERLYKAELAIDPIRETCQLHGFIRIPDPDQMYRGEYERLSRSTKSKYFRRAGIAIDEFADVMNLSVTELLDQLS